MDHFIKLLVSFIAMLDSFSVSGSDTLDNEIMMNELNLLVMIPWPDARDYSISGWDIGLDLLAGGRVAAKEVNESPNILKNHTINLIVTAHEACGLTEEQSSLSNLAYYAINPEINVAAVLGLYCSTSTISLSALAGSADIIHLSGSNSPVFNQQPDRFPHLYRFLQSADVYGKVMVSLMGRYDWKYVGLVQDLKSAYYSEIGFAFSNITKKMKYELKYHGGLVESSFIEETLNEIQESKVRIIFVSATLTQVVDLVCAALMRGMEFPNYVWVLADYRIKEFEDFQTENCNIYDALYGSILLYLVVYNDDDFVIESSNITYAEYKRKYNEELDLVREDYKDLINSTGDEVSGEYELSGILYDQVWAFAIALNNTLPELNKTNYSIEDYGYNQLDVTEMIEEHIEKLDFRGASGTISFSKSREVGSRVELYQTLSNNRTKDFLGFCESVNDTFTCNETKALPKLNFDDEIDSFIVTLPLWLGIFIVVIIVFEMVLITFIFASMIYFRKEPEVKAASPMLSSVMFCGCYLLCFGALMHIIPIINPLPKIAFDVFCNLEVILIANGNNFIFVTLFIKLFRISRIFNNKRMEYLSWVYSSSALLVVVLTITSLLDVILVIMVSADRLTRHSNTVYVSQPGILRNNIFHYCYSSNYGIWFALIYGYLLLVIVLTVYLAFSTRRVPNAIFKDTKKVNSFIFFTVLLFSIPIPIYLRPHMLSESIDEYVLTNTITLFSLIALASLSQIMLFIPKVLPTLCGHSLRYRWTIRNSSFASAVRKNSKFVY